mgnify:CR=1 FL=1|tara:strand:+ start:2756 stop:3244 length:489 start_codon:yes stop_codon:yes gene_type:complete
MAFRFKVYNTKVGKSVIRKLASGGMKGALIGAQMAGFDQAKHNLKQIKKRFPHAFAAALLEQGIMIMDKSVPLAPRLTGDLRRSAKVTAPKTTKRPEVGLGYNVEYALVQHETHRSKSKFLERPYNESLPGAAKRLARLTRKHAQTGVTVGSLQDKTYEDQE